MASASKTRTRSVVKGKTALKAEERESPKRNDSSVVSIPQEMSWEEPFNLEGIPADLRDRLVVLAPCLLGRGNAVYDAVFFHRVGGLCKEGFLPKEVTEAMVPATDYEDYWPPGEGANKSRYLLDKCTKPKHRIAYLKMYQRVYGNAPDNKAFSQTFLRACVYYFNFDGKGGKNKVNWAGAAAKVTEERQAYAHNNPLKLGPPALKQQLAGIIQECAGLLLRAAWWK